MGDMNAPLRTRIREGCRGGREQFTWNSIKDQDFKDREQYLGASTKVGLMGKFGQYYVHDWYSKKRQTTEDIASERQSVQAYEEELMQEALGLKPKKLLLAKKELSESELKEFLKRDSEKSVDKQGRPTMGPQAKLVANEFGEQVATSNEEFVAVAAREAPIKGLGFAHHRSAKLEAIKAEVTGTEGQLDGSKSGGSPTKPVKLEVKEEVKEEEAVKEEPQTDAETSTAAAAAPRGAALGRQENEEEEGPAAKRQRLDGGAKKEAAVKKEKKEKKDKKSKKADKAEKKLKKIEKKLKKAEKKERKAARKGKGSSSSSSSS